MTDTHQESNHIIKLFTVSKEIPMKIISDGQEIAVPDVKLTPGVYEFVSGSYLYRGKICLFQDGYCYDLYNLPKNLTIYGDLDLSGLSLMQLPDLSTTTVLGKFYCSHNLIKDLRGSPLFAKTFDCSVNLELTSFDGATNTVHEFIASVCPRVVSLEHIPYAHIYTLNGNPQLQHSSKYPGSKLFECLPDEFDTLNIQDGPAKIDIKDKKIKIIDVSYNYRRTSLDDIPASADQVIYNNCAQLPNTAIEEYNRRRRTFLELQRQTTLEF